MSRTVVLALVFASTAVPALADPIEVTVSALHAGGFEGVVAVTDRERTLFERAVGLRDKARKIRHDVDQRWPWASVTKQVTALLIMRQIEAGRLSLDTKVRSVLPDFAGPTGDRVTIRDLLQHSSGLPNPADTPKDKQGVPAFYRETGVAIADAARARAFCSGTPKAEPGAGFSYNNCDYQVLGAVLERVTGRSYAQLVREELARPLDLARLGLSPDNAVRGGTDVPGYDAGMRSPQMNFAALGAGGALVGTPRDLLALDRALMNHRLVTPASSATMWQGNPKLGYAALGAWSFPARLRGCDGSVALVERRGHFAGIQVRNIIAPDLGRAIVAFTNNGSYDFGEIWRGSGPSYELASAAFCEQAPS